MIIKKTYIVYLVLLLAINVFSNTGHSDINRGNNSELDYSKDLSFSHPSGFYNSVFQLQISTDVENATLVYTLDGSNPQSSDTRISAGNTVVVEINPLSTQNRAATPAVILRASVVEGKLIAVPLTQTFIFLDQVKTQTYPGGNWPIDSINAQVMDYDMDAGVVEDKRYKSLINKALLEIPSISIVSDIESLFGADSGIYVNALSDGAEWERKCSVELLDHNGKEGFSVDAGIRIRGGRSRYEYYARHAFRLFFREEYGAGKLKYPLFGDEGVDEFDKIDLRCPQSFSWSRALRDEGRKYNTYIRDVFSRDLQRDTGQPYTRSRYYHLYLNGMYWGIYQTQERSEARFAESYLGGKKEDYDVIKSMSTGSKYIMATDGTTDKWREIYGMTNDGFLSNKDYFAIEGKDALGQPIKYAEVFVDVDNLIDYTLSNFYIGNYDSSPSKWAGNNQPNNMYAITNREDKSNGFKFFIHDAEFSLMVEPMGPGIGLYENRVNIGDISGRYQMTANSFSVFSIQWLHYKLSKNKEYRIRFADRAYQHLTGDGILTPLKNLERFNNRVAEIDTAMIAESARWGDGAKEEFPRMTVDDDWIPELDQIRNSYIPHRSDILIDQLLDENLFPVLDVPIIRSEENMDIQGAVQIESEYKVSFNNPISEGKIYYTMDGSDPRKIGGDISGSAIEIASGAKTTVSGSQIIKARIKSNNNWSALNQVTFLYRQTDFSHLKITELHYHPLDSIQGEDTVSGKDFEFIEFKNTSENQAINLSGLSIDSAIAFQFPENSILQAQAYFVISSRPSKFYERYGMIASGNFKKNLSNKSEQIVVLTESGDPIIDFAYKDNTPWPILPDGDGPSLTSVETNPSGDPGSYTYWGPSLKIHGTPFTDGDINYSTETPTFTALNLSVLVYPNPTSNILNISLNENTNSLLKFYDIKGSLIFEEYFYQSLSISLSELNVLPGIYISQITTSKGVINKKIIFR